MLAGIIQLYFEEQRPPGSILVKRGDYQLVSGLQRSIVESSRWTFLVEPGLTVEMSMVRHDSENRTTSCPRCGLVSTAWAKNEWAAWFVTFTFFHTRDTHNINSTSCGAAFQITEEISLDDVLITPAA